MVKKKVHKKITEKKISKKEIPLGVKIFSMLDIVGGIIGVIIFPLLFILGVYISKNPSLLNTPEILAKVSDAGIANAQVFLGNLVFLVIVFSILLFFMSILNIFIGRGLWKGKNWARLTEIVFACLGIILGIISIVLGDFLGTIPNLIINGFIIWYFGFKENVKKFFGK